MALKCFTTNYHISVNNTLVKDLIAAGLEVAMPDGSFGISFYAPNDEHRANGAQIVGKSQFMSMEPMAILIPCMQLVEDFMKLWEERGKVDKLILLTANSDHSSLWKTVPTDYLISHDLAYHRQFTGKYKILYFNRPTILRHAKTEDELYKSFNEKKIKLYINNFYKPGFEPELEQAEYLRKLWLDKTGWTIPFYGYDNPDGWPSMQETQNHMVDSMFTLVSKRRETWGQCVNESMLLGTPCIFFKQFFNSTFTEYEMNQDTAVIGDTAEDIVANILSMRYEDYQTLVNEAYSQADMFTTDINRQNKLRWLFDKVAEDLA